MNKFQELGIEEGLLQSIQTLGFTQPTPIQEKAIPVLLQGTKDFIGLAQTGTGKTAAFGLPLLQLIRKEDKYPQALIICPTRELCLQITNDLEKFKNIPWGEYLPLLEERGIAERALTGSGVPFTIIRTGNVPDPAVPATGAAYLTEDQSVFGVSTRPDLAKLTADCISARKCRNKVFHAADRKLKPPI